MAADQQIDLIINQSASFSVTLTWVAAGAAIDNTSYTARMQLRSDSFCLDLTSANGRLTLGGTNGKITIALTAAETSALVPGCFSWDLLMINGATVHRMAEGYALVERGVTTLA